jgi:hypothetical protein
MPNLIIAIKPKRDIAERMPYRNFKLGESQNPKLVVVPLV